MLEPVLHIHTLAGLEWAYSLGKELHTSTYIARLDGVCRHEIRSSLNVIAGVVCKGSGLLTAGLPKSCSVYLPYALIQGCFFEDKVSSKI